MTIDVAFSPEHRVIFGTVQGHPRMASFGSIVRTSIRFDVLGGDSRVIVDLRRQTGSDLTSGLLHSYVSRFDRALGARGWHVDFALLAEVGSFGYGMGRMFLAYAEPCENITAVLLDSPAGLDAWSGVEGILDMPRLPFRMAGAMGTRAGEANCETDWQCGAQETVSGGIRPCPARYPDEIPCLKGLMNRSPRSI